MSRIAAALALSYAANVAAQGLNKGAGNCMPPDTFTTLNLDQYTGTAPSVTTNNLGGVGPLGGAQELYFSNIGFAVTKNAANGAPLDLRVRAVTDYRASNNELNGFGFNNNGRFGVINLRGPGPICPQCTGIGGEWHPQLVYTDFEFDIVNQNTGALLDVTGGFKTFLTFYDFDTLPDQGNGLRSVECVGAEPLNGGSIVFRSADPTELVEAPMSTIETRAANDGTYTPATAPSGFAGANIFCASQYGTAADNPSDPLNLTPLQSARSMHLEIEDTASVLLRVALHTAPSTTGRNFLFGGKIPLPPCPTPVVVVTDPHFVAAHGDSFDFKGKHGTIYNLLSHAATSVNALFEHVDYREQGKNHRLVHGSYMRTVYAKWVAPSGRFVHVEYSAKQAKSVTYTVVDASGEEVAEDRVTLLSTGWSLTLEGGLALGFDGKELTITTPEWTVGASNKVKPGIVGATTCATGKCFLEVSITPRFDADHAKVAPHGLIGQSYDQDDAGVLGAIDAYVTKGNETSTEAMGEGAIEGVAANYEVASKFATAFKFSRFGKTAAAPRDVAALTGKKIKRVETQGAKAVDDRI